MKRNMTNAPAKQSSRRSIRVRAFLSLGILLGFSSVNTLAFWTDSATMTTGTITSGSLDLQLNGNLAGQGGTWTNSAFTFSNMIPGESFAVTVPVQRAAGTAPFTYTATGTSTGGLASHLRWAVHAGTANTAVTSANGVRTQTCGGTALPTGVTLGGSATSVISTARSLTGSTYSENICIQVSLPATATNAAQLQNATASFTFNAVQATS